MPDKKLTDSEIVKALPFLAKYCKKEYNEIRVNEVLLGAFDLINRLQAENEKLAKVDYFQWEKDLKAEGYKECIEKVKEEIAEALKSNYKARIERGQSIPIFTDDEFTNYVSGKIDCLRGLDDFLDNLLKELVGEGNG